MMTPARFAQDAVVVVLVAVACWQLLSRLGVGRAVAARLGPWLGGRPLPRLLRPLRVWAQRVAPKTGDGCGSGCGACQGCGTPAAAAVGPGIAPPRGRRAVEMIRFHADVRDKGPADSA